MGGFFAVLININEWILHLLFPGVPNIFHNLEDTLDNIISSGAISQFRTWMGYVFYFIPWSFVRPLLLMAISFIILRIVFALFRVITDLL